MQNSPTPREPMFNFSERVPVFWGGLLIAIEFVMMILPRSVESYALVFGLLRPWGTVPTWLQFPPLIGHGFFHSGWSHVLMNTFLGVVFGIVAIRGAKMLATSKGKRTSGTFAFIALFLGGVVLGGLAQWLVWALTNAPSGSAMLGASGGVSAFFAAAGWAMGGRQKMLQFGFGWLVINFALVVAEPILGVSVSWAGHLGGYLAGMSLAPMLVRANSTGFSVLR